MREEKGGGKDCSDAAAPSAHTAFPSTTMHAVGARATALLPRRTPDGLQITAAAAAAKRDCLLRSKMMKWLPYRAVLP